MLNASGYYGVYIGYQYTGRIQNRVLTNCQAIDTEIGTDSLKIE